jgi:DNA-binding NarL/FixJ family response regulator
MRPAPHRPGRILLVGQHPDRLAVLVPPATRLGLEVTRKEAVAAVAVAIIDEQPFDVAIVAAGDDSELALHLIGHLAREADCPVIVLVDVEDPAFLHQAAERGVFAYLTSDDVDGDRFESTIDIARHRYVGTVQDVTERRQIAREMAGHIAMEEVLATWVTLEQDAERLLATLGEAEGFSVAALWLRRDDFLAARCRWNSGPLAGPPLEANLLRLEPGSGRALPVQAWLSREPVVVANLASAAPFAGRDAAVRSGFQGAMAFPAVSEDEVFAVLEFSSRETLQPTETLPRSLTGMGHELGYFFARRRGELRPHELTAREREILQLAAQGMSGRTIANRLTLSPSTVKTHFENIYAKWDVSDRASAVAKALREGLIH